ncbi:hypothetical protein SESBI_34996 [Sesbania bispinosa]|nr:hypothetical protein SESBI_34996 [Sesbania bispinosa]
MGLAKVLGYVDRVNMWWKQKGVGFKRGLRKLRNDEDALELCNIAETKKREMEIHLEHGLSSEANVQNLNVPLLTDKTKTEKVQENDARHGSDVHHTVEVEAEADSDVSEDSIRDVLFDDSEEEKALEADDGFNHGTKENVETSGVHKSGENEGTGANGGVFAPENLENMYTMEEDYESAELPSGADICDDEEAHNSQQAQRKEKSKQTSSTQQTQTMRVTRSSQQSQQTIPKKRKVDQPLKKEHQQLKMELMPTSGEKRSHCHQVHLPLNLQDKCQWQHHLVKLQAAASAQAEELGVEQYPVEPTLSEAATTVEAPTPLEPILAGPSTANVEQIHEVGQSKKVGKKSVKRWHKRLNN